MNHGKRVSKPGNSFFGDLHALSLMLIDIHHLLLNGSKRAILSKLGILIGILNHWRKSSTEPVENGRFI